MSDIEFGDAGVSIDASIIAKELGLHPESVLDETRAGRLTCVHETGTAEDIGRTRLTFQHDNRRLRLTLDATGQIIDRSSTHLRTKPRGPRSQEGD